MEAGAITMIMVGFLLGSFCSIHIWIKIAQKTNNDRKTIIITAFFMAVTLIPMIFLRNYFLFIISVAIWGIGLGGFWAMQSPVLSNAIDESVINTGKREPTPVGSALIFTNGVK